jgi:glycosyltransferase involved in cell wall biosynthesis
MKILVISQYYFPEPFKISDICEQMVLDGHDVTVLTGHPNYPNGKIYDYYTNTNMVEIVNNVTLHRVKIYPRKKGSLNLFLNYMSFMFNANRYMKNLNEDFDIVFINQLSPVLSAVPGLKISKRKNIPSVLYCLDLWPESLVSGGIKRNSIIYKVFEKISTRIYESVSNILITSKSFSGKFKTINCNKVTYLPQYAESIFDNVITLNNDYYDFVFAGNIGEMQSVETIINAANLLKYRGDIKFHIVGDGSKLSEVEQLSKQLNLPNVIFYGRKPLGEMVHFYSLADAMLVTLKNDDQISQTLPGKVQSYMAAGKPIIASITGETKTIIEEASCGIVCEPENPEELAQVIIDFINLFNNVDYGNNARKYYKDNFSKNRFFDKLYEVLKEEIHV